MSLSNREHALPRCKLKYPESFASIPRWAQDNGISVQEARIRFAQYAVLHAIANSRALSATLVFKGGNALDLIWEPNRSTKDLDFSAAPGKLLLQDLKNLLAKSLQTTTAITSVALRVQHLQQNPPGPDKSFPSYLIKIGYAMPDDLRSRERILREGSVSSFLPMDISLNDPVCATTEIDINATNRLQVCTLEDIVAEKLRALLQQAPRNRWRCQDVLDVAVILASQAKLDQDDVASFLIVKARARNIEVSRKAFANESRRERASANYGNLEATTRRSFIPFETAFSKLMDYVASLPIPE